MSSLARRGLAFVVAWSLGLMLLVWVASAGAHVGVRLRGEVASSQHSLDMSGPGIEKLPNGLYRLTLSDGTQLLTHGYDPVLPNHGGAWWINSSNSRNPACATDHYFHVLYGFQTGEVNRLSYHTSRIRQYVSTTNWLLNYESTASGNRSADYKVLCNAAGDIVVDAFESPGLEGRLIIDSASRAGFNKENVKYWIFFEGSSPGLCGQGTFRTDESLSLDNSNNKGRSYAISYEGCWDGRTPMHEAGHTMGAVQDNAPGSTAGGHCNEDIDVMCYTPDGGTQNQTMVHKCLDYVHFDCGWDTYFDSEPEEGEYLSAHWNIGWAYNRFLRIGGDRPTLENAPPSARFTVACSGATCSFTDLSTDSDGEVVGWAWNFGDGTTSSSRNPTHSYAASASYNTSLTVTDDRGASSTLSKVITVDAEDPDPSTQTLSNGQSKNVQVGGPGSWRFFKIRVPEGSTSLSVELDGPTCESYSAETIFCGSLLEPVVPSTFRGQLNAQIYGQLNLYVRRSYRPTLDLYDCRPFDQDSDEICEFSSPEADYWFMGIHHESGAQGRQFSIKATYT